MYKKLATLALLFFMLAEMAQAQSFYSRNRNRYWVIGGGFGIGSYYGDLNNPGDIIDFTPDATFNLRYNFNRNISVGANISWFMLRGDDTEATAGTGRDLRNLSFTSHNFELSVVGYYDFIPSGLRFYQRPVASPYAFAGVGFAYYNPRAEYEGSWYALRPLQLEGNAYSAITPVVPLGFGVRFRATPFLNITLEGGYRITFTDYLDDVSTVYQDPSTFTDPIALALSDRRPEIGLPRKEAGAIRGNPEKNDGYFLASIKVEYFLSGSLFGGDRFNRSIRQRR